MNAKPIISRRRFLVTTAQTVTGFFLCPPLTCWARKPKEFPLTFFHTHTEECLRIMHTPGHCSNSVQKKIKTFLRDFRTGDVHPIDPKLLDIICRIQAETASRGTIEIISGYRSPQTNNFLCHKSSDVAQKSLHMKGQAVDIRITDLRTRQLHKTATALRAGGVGYYAKSDFVHLDTGRFRTW
jgi:uncharacterized protein YcbK (DUF882 family)